MNLVLIGRIVYHHKVCQMDDVHLEGYYLELMHSPEVQLNEIFVSNIFNGNGLAPSDMPPDTKNTTRGVQKIRNLKIL